MNGSIDVDYAFQELSDIPDGFSLSAGRTKPWGTGHASLTAAPAVDGSFAVINADDFYGADAYRVLADYLEEGERMRADAETANAELKNTTIGVVATNAKLSKAQASRLAIMATDGLATAIRPAHPPSDGDTVFALATGKFDLAIEAHPSLITLLGAMAARALGQAIVNGVQAAEGLVGVPSPSEWRRRR